MCFIPHGCAGMNKMILQLEIILKQFGLMFAKLYLNSITAALCNNYLEAWQACVHA